MALLTDDAPLRHDALLTMPAQPLECERRDVIAAFLRHREELRGAALGAAPTRANTKPAFGC